MTNPTLSKMETVDLFQDQNRLATREEQTRFWAMLKAWLIDKQNRK